MSSQALAFLPNEIWIHAGDSITWPFASGDTYTVTFLTVGQICAFDPDRVPNFRIEMKGTVIALL